MFYKNNWLKTIIMPFYESTKSVLLIKLLNPQDHVFLEIREMKFGFSSVRKEVFQRGYQKIKTTESAANKVVVFFK